jgi:hypothetical protein
LIQFIDEAMEALLRREVPLPEDAVDISFAAPDRAWGAGVTRPTINVFLWDIRRNQLLTSTGLGQKYSDGQHTLRRPTDPVVDLRYLVTAWASEHRDEHQLLGSVLRCILANSSLPENVMPQALAGAPFAKLSLATEEARVPGEFWSSLDGRLKPGLQVVVTLPVGVFDWLPAGPPATAIAVGTQRMGNGAQATGTERVAPEDEPVLRRRRSSGVLTMEGRPFTAAPAGPGQPNATGDQGAEGPASTAGS